MVKIMMNSRGEQITMLTEEYESFANELEVNVLTPQSNEDIEEEYLSSPNSFYEDGTDLMTAAMGNELTAQLAISGPAGVSAAAAIVSSNKRKRPHSFETHPSVRKRLQNRLLKQLRKTINEFATRIGLKAIVLVANPGKSNSGFKVFGTKPLDDVIKQFKELIMENLEEALADQAPPPVKDDPSLFELPPLIIDGIPASVEKMTQAQLRAFIPLMLKYSTGRTKPGWGRETTRPVWWPSNMPWKNVRMDARTEEEKQQVPWTVALRQVVINCYKYHGREDLLSVFSENDDKDVSTNTQSDQETTVLHTINSNGSINILQVDSNPIITLSDGTQAQFQQLTSVSPETSSCTINTISTTGEIFDLNTVTEATLSADGQLILTSKDGHNYQVSIDEVVTVPVSSSMYQNKVENIQNENVVQTADIASVSQTKLNTSEVKSPKAKEYDDEVMFENTKSKFQPEKRRKLQENENN